MGTTPARRPSDRELISRFLAARDESAFAEIVRRYSRLVMSVALHALRDQHAAEDAFQATFLVLARSARRIRNRDSLASWLHGTTFRVSRRLLRTRLRRKEQDLPPVELPAPWD
ncbi:MAG TPA: sigma factor, partial [Caulifigura sp.]|nr:sigma factor [Caulifigura sp.]